MSTKTTRSLGIFVFLFVLLFLLSNCVAAVGSDAQNLYQQMDEYEEHKAAAHRLAQSARQLGYDENSELIRLAKLEWKTADVKQRQCKQQLELLYSPYAEHAREFPVATEVWIYLQDKGFNKYVCAGILGNMMTECGGQTLALQPKIYGGWGGFYGLCQWSKTWCSPVFGLEVKEQLDYLIETMPREFELYGFVYEYGFDYSDFLALQNERDAALAFSKVYERNVPDSYWNRQQNAETALQYFVG